MVPDTSPCVIDIKKSDHSSVDITSLFLDHLHSHDGTVAVYTDGSKKNDSVGCAAVVGRSEYSAGKTGLPLLVSGARRHQGERGGR